MEIFPCNFKANGTSSLPSIESLSSFYEELIYINEILVQKKYYQELSDSNEYIGLVASILYAHNFETKIILTTIEWAITDPNDENNTIHSESRKRLMPDDEIIWIQYKQDQILAIKSLPIVIVDPIV